MGKVEERLDPFAGNVSRIQAFIHLQRYRYAQKEAKGMVLDLGCGLGYGSKILYRTHNFVVSLDISDKALSYARIKYRGPIYVRGDAQMLPFKNESFDSVVALEIIEHVDNNAQMLKEVFRVLKRKGTLILSAPNVAHLGNRIKRLLFRRNLIKAYAYTQKNLIISTSIRPNSLQDFLNQQGL